MIKNKSFFKNLSIFLCLVPMLLLSLFAMIPHNNISSVYADSTSYDNLVFRSSNIIYSAIGNSDEFDFSNFNGLLYNNATSPQTSIDWLNFSFEIYLNNGILTPYVRGYQDYNYGLTTTSLADARLFNKINDFDLSTSNSSLSVMKNLYFRVANYNYCTAVGFIVYREGGLNSSVPSLEMYNIEIGNYSNSSFINLGVDLSKFSNSNVVCYTDTNNYKYMFFIPIYQTIDSNPNLYYDYRQYFYSSAFDFTDNDYYNAGYNDGYSVGATDGNSSGYQEGYSAGQTIGYQDGYSAGIDHSNNYSFTRLIGAVIDAPVSAFTSLLNFNILGVNILSFVTGLLTLALIIFIIKLCMGGK